MYNVDELWINAHKIAKEINYTSIQFKHILLKYEELIQHTILDIASKNSLKDVKELFDILEQIQSQLSLIEFKYDIRIGDKLFEIVRNFDRLDDEFSRDYWFKQFKNGLTWPLSI